MKMNYRKQKLRQVLDITSMISIHYFEFTKSFTYDGESHPFWEFVYIDTGEIEVIADDKIFILKKDEVVFHKPDEFHNIICNGEIAPNVIIISFNTNSRYMKFFEKRIMHLSDPQKKMLAEIVAEAMTVFKGPFDVPFIPKMSKNTNVPFGAEQRLKNLLELFLIELTRQDDSTVKSKRLLNPGIKSSAYGIVVSIVDFLGQNLYATYTLDELCKRFNISKSLLKQVFKAVTGKPLMHYYTQLKISEAKRLLREEKLNITAIAQALGFSSIHYFSRCFKKTVGMSPTRYAATIKAKLQL